MEDVTSSPIFVGTPALAAMLEAEARAVQSTPLVSRSGKLLGMFSTHYRTPRRPTERDLRLLDVLARQAADLIERKRSEDIRGQLSAIVESSGDAIYIYDFKGKVLTWNRAAEELYGYSERDIVGRNVREVVPQITWPKSPISSTLRFYRARSSGTWKANACGATAASSRPC